MGRPGVAAAFAFLLLVPVACGAQELPSYGEAFGGFDYPCAFGMSPSDTVLHCIAHVTLVNHGGEGIGHVTLQVPLKDAKGSSPATIVTCGTPVPNLPPEGNIDLVCNFDLPPGKVVAGVPDVKSVDYVAATTNSSQGFDFTGAAMLILGGATLFLALAVLVAAIRREGASGSQGSAALAREVSIAGEEDEPSSEANRNVAEDAEYDIPPLPR